MSKYVGVVLTQTPEGRFSVFEVTVTEDAVLDLAPIETGSNRNKGSAIRQCELALTKLSQAITRGQVSFFDDESEEGEE